MNSLPDLYKRRRFTEKGYFFFPLTAHDRDVPNYQQWQAFEAILSEAKQGNFTHVPSLADRIAQTKDWVVQGLLVRLFGDAGPSWSLHEVLQTYPAGRNGVLEFAYGQAFENWGHLSVIPILVDLYGRYYYSQDSMYVAQGLSRLMEDVPGEISEFPLDEGEAEVKRYCDMVFHRYEELCGRLGTHDAVVFRGEVISVQQICRKMLEDLAIAHGFHEEMRHKFEAYTGIDCSDFYVNEVLQPLAVAAIVEEFLASPEAAKYEDGVRYFFGHRIPD